MTFFRVLLFTFIIIILLLEPFSVTAGTEGHKEEMLRKVKPRVVISEFINLSDYRGNWKLKEAFPRLLISRLITDTYFVFKKLPEAALMLKSLRNRKIPPKFKERIVRESAVSNQYLLGGVIDAFSLSGQGASIDRLGGYRRWHFKLKMRIAVQDLSSGRVRWDSFKESLTSHDVGFTIIGGPGGMEDFDGFYLDRIEKIPFGSPAFRSSLPGRTHEKLIGALRDWLLARPDGVLLGDLKKSTSQ